MTEGERLWVSRICPGQIFSVDRDAEGCEVETIAEAAGDWTLMRSIPYTSVLWAVTRSERAVAEMLSVQERRRREFSTALAAVAFYPVGTRLARALLTLVRGRSDAVLHATHGGLADWVATTRQRVTEHLNDFRRRRLVDYNRRDPHDDRIRVLDLNGLAAEARQRSYCPRGD